MNNNVVSLHVANANCPDCKSIYWEIILDGFGFEWNHIKAFRCADCGCEITIRETVE